MSNYSKKSLKGKVAEVRKKIKEQSLDKKATNKLLDELLELKAQMDVVPTELCVNKEDVIATYDFGSFSLIRCKTCIIFKCTGYRVVVKPLYNQGEDGGVLFNHLESLCDMKERFNEIDDKTKELYTLVFNVTILILSLPLDVFSDDKFLFDIATYIAKRKNEYYEELLNTKLKDETIEGEIKNEQFKEMALGVEEMQEDEKEDKE